MTPPSANRGPVITRRRFVVGALGAAGAAGVLVLTARQRQERNKAIKKWSERLGGTPASQALANIQVDVYGERLSEQHLKAILSVSETLGIHPARVFHTLEHTSPGWSRRADEENPEFIGDLMEKIEEISKLKDYTQRNKAFSGNGTINHRRNLVACAGYEHRNQGIRRAFIAAHAIIENTSGSERRLNNFAQFFKKEYPH